MPHPDLDLAHLRAIAEAASKRAPHSRWDYVNANCVGGNTVYGLRADDEESDFIACDVDVEAIGEHIATFDPPAVLALIARAEKAEAALGEAWASGFDEAAKMIENRLGVSSIAKQLIGAFRAAADDIRARVAQGRK